MAAVGWMVLALVVAPVAAQTNPKPPSVAATPVLPPAPGGPTAPTERRVALVIGNARYATLPLNNPENDARVVGQTLRRLGFEVIEHVNLPVKRFRQVLRDYVRRLQNESGVGLFFYAGHGVQIDGRNYLLPVDINLRDEDEIRDEAVDIDDLFLSKLGRAKTQGLIVILDACRDNPFAGKTRSVQGRGGLAEMGARGALIAYSAGPGATANDGPEGTNSVFTRHLVREMTEPGIEIESMFKNVRVKVLQDTRQQQVPWVNSSLAIPFSFNPAKPSSTLEEARQRELKDLQDRLVERDRQDRERERQMQEMKRKLDEATAGAARPPASASPAPTSPTAPPSTVPPVTATAAPKPVPKAEEPPRKEPATTGPPQTVARAPPTAQTPASTRADAPPPAGATPARRSESERCVALQLRAQLGEPVSEDELRKECRR